MRIAYSIVCATADDLIQNLAGCYVRDLVSSLVESLKQ